MKPSITNEPRKDTRGIFVKTEIVYALFVFLIVSTTLSGVTLYYILNTSDLQDNIASLSSEISMLSSETEDLSFNIEQLTTRIEGQTVSLAGGREDLISRIEAVTEIVGPFEERIAILQERMMILQESIHGLVAGEHQTGAIVTELGVGKLLWEYYPDNPRKISFWVDLSEMGALEQIVFSIAYDVNGDGVVDSIDDTSARKFIWEFQGSQGSFFGKLIVDELPIVSKIEIYAWQGGGNPFTIRYSCIIEQM